MEESGMLIKDLHIPIKRGAIHVGAHEGEEREFYKDFTKTIWFEPDNSTFIKLFNNLKNYPNQVPFHWGIHDELKFAELNIASNDGQSSSILELGLHSTYHPNVKYVGKKKVPLIRLDEFFKMGIREIKDFNFLNIDVQGVELNVIKSLGAMIMELDYIYTEVNDQELYKGCCLVEDLDLYLDECGFIRTQTVWTKNHWGDALYVKKSLL